VTGKAPPSFAFAIDSAELPDGEGRQLIIAGQSVAVFRDRGCVRAVDGICPHAGSPLGPGWVTGGCVECPWHGWRFSLEDGTSPDVPGLAIAVYETVERGGRIYVKIPG
jgi:nitrite reductase/ring-hydroxylating ferredoxin subunit